MKTINELKELLSDFSNSENDKTIKESFVEKAGDLIYSIEIDVTEYEDEIKELNGEIGDLKDVIGAKESDISDLADEKTTLKDKVENAIIPTNMNEEDKLEIVKRLYKNCTLSQLNALEEYAMNIVCRDYNIHVSW